MKKRRIIAFLLGLALAGLLLPSQARAILNEISSTGVLKVGVRDDALLFGFRKGRERQGYCVDLASAFAQSLSKELQRPVRVMFYSSTTQGRWELVNRGTVHLECGPNTITRAREVQHGIKFSAPFFIRATQVIVRPGTTERDLDNAGNGQIGVLRGTTTEADIRQVYSGTQIDNRFSRRDQGLSAVFRREITGFASDGILLIGAAIERGLDKNDFNFVTPINENGRPFCAAYGMILPTGDENAQWRNTVNSFVAFDMKNGRVWDNWFGKFLPYLGAVIDSCK
ncbi:MAG: transporter substrate-binding domain-containing protein [Hormoscilla sp.]